MTNVGRPKIDLIGRRFGRLTVVRMSGKTPHGNIRFDCLCDCGNRHNVASSKLRTGSVKSCGCLSRDVRSALSKAQKGMLSGERNPMWCGGMATTSRGYKQKLLPEHPFSDSYGYVMEHRLVFEKVLGRFLKTTEVVHHIDENKSNNGRDNLVLFRYRSAHSRLHRFAQKHKIPVSVLVFSQPWL